MVEIYCVKDKKKVKVDNTTFEVTANGGIRVVGPCPICGTRIGTFTSASKAPADIVKQAEKNKANRPAGKPRKSKKKSAGKSKE